MWHYLFPYSEDNRQILLCMATLPCLRSDITRQYACRYLNPHWLWLAFTLFLSLMYTHTHTHIEDRHMRFWCLQRVKGRWKMSQILSGWRQRLSNASATCWRCARTEVLWVLPNINTGGRPGWKGFCLPNSRFEKINVNVLKPHEALPTMHWNYYIGIQLTDATNI